MGRRPIAFARILGGDISQEGRALKSPPFQPFKNALIECKVHLLRFMVNPLQ